MSLRDKITVPFRSHVVTGARQTFPHTFLLYVHVKHHNTKQQHAMFTKLSDYPTFGSSVATYYYTLTLQH